MKLFLIRHGETVDNVAQVYAGTTDSALTVHGSLQARKLGSYLAERYRFSNIFSSDLQRAAKTAEAIRRAQRHKYGSALEDVRVRQMPILQEQDFGYYEGKRFNAQPRDASRSGKKHDRYEQLEPGLKAAETKAEMAIRMNKFLDDSLLPILRGNGRAQGTVIAIVSHGMILSTLWKCLLKRFALHGVKLGSGIQIASNTDSSLEHLGAWSNTGYLELDIEKEAAREKAAGITEILATSTLNDEPSADNMNEPTILYGWIVTIRAINSKAHLQGTKRTGGGVGSSKHDESQKSIDGFFKKQRTA